MPGHQPSPSPAALAALRQLVNSMHSANGQGVPLTELVALAGQKLDAGVTIDFAATQQLGQPMVVLRMAPCPPATWAGLSARERDVAGLVAEGLANKQIGRKLGIALATVKDHVHRILAKTALPNRAAIAVAWSQVEGRLPD